MIKLEENKEIEFIFKLIELSESYKSNFVASLSLNKLFENEFVMDFLLNFINVKTYDNFISRKNEIDIICKIIYGGFFYFLS